MRPSYLVIGGKRFAVRYVASDQLPEDTSAQVHFDRMLIEVSKAVEPAVLPYYLGHEAVHVFLAWTLSELLPVLGNAGSHLEEALCDAIGHQLIAFVKDNQHLIDDEE